jgi:putative component of membrane protein insertase Oxa1/YidC/SpoIIIJ protein YidD
MLTLTSLDPLTRQTAVMLITGYQRYLSPHKGFSCAHRIWHQGESCSQYVKRVVAEQGLGAAIPLVRQRFRDCRAANDLLHAHRQRRHVALAGAWAIEDASEGSDETPESPQRNTAPQRSSARSPQAHYCNPRDSRWCNPDCSNLACEGLDCAGDFGSLDCQALPCQGEHCGAADCGSADCSGLDCGGLDCGGLDCGGCG